MSRANGITETADLWQVRATEIRQLALTATLPHSKTKLQQIAFTYERRAADLEARRSTTLEAGT